MDKYNLHRTPRQKKLERLRAYVDGTQYEGRPHFLDQSDPSPPLLERAPCVVYPITENAIRSHCEMLFGDGRAPTVDTGSAEIEPGDIIDAANAMTRNVLQFGESYAICAIDSLGMNSVDVVCPSKVYDVRLNEFGNVTALEIRYPYRVEYKDHNGEYQQKCMLFRRVIDHENDVTFFAVEAPDDARSAIAWVPNPELSIAHGLGFCPVLRWCRETAIHERYFDEIDALNRTLSQRNRAALYAGDPQIWETGVSVTDPQAVGRFASMDAHNPEKKYATYSTGSARKKGVGIVWTSSNENASFGMLTLPGDALKAIDDECARLRAMLMESFSYVDIDLSQSGIASDASGKALEILHARQIAFDSQLRREIERCVLGPMVEMFALLRGTSAALSVVWGRWFQPTSTDAMNAVSAASAAMTAGLLSLAEAREYVSQFFNIEAK